MQPTSGSDAFALASDSHLTIGTTQWPVSFVRIEIPSKPEFAVTASGLPSREQPAAAGLEQDGHDPDVDRFFAVDIGVRRHNVGVTVAVHIPDRRGHGMIAPATCAAIRPGSEGTVVVV
jgi:hypothetical protein